jgi:hypothetical protein
MEGAPAAKVGAFSLFSRRALRLVSPSFAARSKQREA